jgi:hypothetical protein
MIRRRSLLVKERLSLRRIGNDNIFFGAARAVTPQPEEEIWKIIK